MENTLSAFLAQNALPVENVKYIASNRFIGEDGKPMEWEICAISTEEDEKLRRECTKRVKVPGKRGQYANETDYEMYLGKQAARCTVFPNLNDAGLQDSYHVMGADALLKKMLIAGEYPNYLAKVQEVNGFDRDFSEEVNEAKN